MFSLRRRRPQPVAPAPTVLDESAVYDAVHRILTDAVGENGTWVLSRRSANDRDDIFHGMFARALTLEVTSAVLAAQRTAAPVAETSVAPALAALPPVTSPIAVVQASPADRVAA